MTPGPPTSAAEVVTPRLLLRLPVEADRVRFVELFGDPDFMVFSDGPLAPAAAGERFDGMITMAAEIAFAKQPIVERSTGTVVGYAGADWFEHDGTRALEFGYRLVAEARGLGYATEAAGALLDAAAATYQGELVAIIDPRNTPSQRVAAKLGFAFWKLALVDGRLRNLYRLQIG